MYEILLTYVVICRMVWLLDAEYDVEHRAYWMAEKGEVIK